ncbi:MlaA family lipoprotein [Henriciella mobilis]|uniref:VacJ family lipoprotein n=1 Tax=Henriciella mobilis TaxID=2305467 RepID=A0A399RL42_9PROT|nr:VacJ family lipoprotein [Henriciella mobilis]RIJ18450.1 VacJ family lipoprotein [Henriciella mobilis]RIJ25671.1 VacJ family lipoprotein [Henriciella mobilis]RIJ30727.1 VacJ family lipoprotein [Henriciella mobilis]
MKFQAVAALAVLTVSACATTQPSQSGEVYDPWEGWNRKVYGFNEVVDKAALEPVARAYRVATPTLFREGVNNVLSNLRQPVVFVNTVLQGNPDASGETFGRFLINSTAGVAGIFDVASALGVAKHDEDFGQTLGVWGVEPGPYIILPVMGPSNLRDFMGRGVDNAFDPLNWTEFEDRDLDNEIMVTRTVVGAIATRERLIETIETLRDQPEPYIAMRRNYTSQRQAAIRNGKIEDDPYKDLPDFDDFDEFGFEEESGSDQPQD